MGKRITCPACGSRGELDDDTNFELRGRFQGRAVQKCLRCGSGVFVKPPLGRTEVVPHDLWIQMQQRWAEEFGEDDAEDEGSPVVHEAIQDLFDDVPDEMPASLMVLSSSAHDMAGVALQWVSKEYPEWAELGREPTKRVVKSAATYFIMVAGRDPQLRAMFAESLDCRPSEVVRQLWDGYCEAFLSPEDVVLAEEALRGWKSDDATRYPLALARLLYAAAGRKEVPDPFLTHAWRSALHELRTAFGEHFISELHRFGLVGTED